MPQESAYFRFPEEQDKDLVSFTLHRSEGAHTLEIVIARPMRRPMPNSWDELNDLAARGEFHLLGAENDLMKKLTSLATCFYNDSIPEFFNGKGGIGGTKPRRVKSPHFDIDIAPHEGWKVTFRAETDDEIREFIGGMKHDKVVTDHEMQDAYAVLGIAGREIGNGEAGNRAR